MGREAFLGRAVNPRLWELPDEGFRAGRRRSHVGLPELGEENPARARLCKMCGAALGSVPGEVVEERKIVSVLFTTRLASPLDPTAPTPRTCVPPSLPITRW